jgi:hypothetical protein
MLASALALSPAALANAPQIHPGLWEFSMAGVPMKQTMCVTPAMANDVTKFGQGQQPPNSDCKSSSPTVSGNTTTFNVSCTKPSKYSAKVAMTANGPDNFTMAQDYDMEMNGQRQKGSMTMNYKRIGECRK